MKMSIPHPSGTGLLDPNLTGHGAFPRTDLFFILDNSSAMGDGSAVFWAKSHPKGRVTNLRRALLVTALQARDLPMETHDVLVPERVARDAAIMTVTLVALEREGGVKIVKEKGGMRTCDAPGCGNYALYRFATKGEKNKFSCNSLEHRPPLPATGSRVQTQSGRGFLSNGRVPR